MDKITSFGDLMVMDITQSRKVVFLEQNISVEDALEILETKKILSAPIIDLKAGTFAGILDMFAIVTFVLGIFPDVEKITPKNLETLEWAGKCFAETPVKDVMKMVEQYEGFKLKVKPVLRTTTLVKLADHFYIGHHRVPVVDSQKKIVNLVTQSDLLAFLARHIHLIKDDAKKTIEEMGFGKEKPVTAVGSDTVARVLMHVNAKRLSALPVVDKEGKLIGNFSASDLKGLNRKNLGILLMPVLEFLKKRAEPEDNFSCERSLHPLTLTKDSHIDDAIFKMVATRVHRLWVVDGQHKPVGVVSLTDLMKVFFPPKNVE
jgi:CBS domain-containing protein